MLQAYNILAARVLYSVTKVSEYERKNTKTKNFIFNKKLCLLTLHQL